MCAVNALSLPAQRCPLMLEMSGSENIPCCPHVAVRLIESSHDPLSSGYAYDVLPPGQAMMEHDRSPPSASERTCTGCRRHTPPDSWLCSERCPATSNCRRPALASSTTLGGQSSWSHGGHGQCCGRAGGPLGHTHVPCT